MQTDRAEGPNPFPGITQDRLRAAEESGELQTTVSWRVGEPVMVLWDYECSFQSTASFDTADTADSALVVQQAAARMQLGRFGYEPAGPWENVRVDGEPEADGTWTFIRNWRRASAADPAAVPPRATVMSEMTDRDWNALATFLPPAHLDDEDGDRELPAIRIAGNLVFAYIKDGELVISAHLDESELLDGNGNVPIQISVQERIVFHAPADPPAAEHRRV
jgi:hypothetical protein